jgi:hypothetical protein
MLAILFPHLYEDVDEEMGITGTADADGIDDASRMLIDEDVARRLRVDAAERRAGPSRQAGTGPSGPSVRLD